MRRKRSLRRTVAKFQTGIIAAASIVICALVVSPVQAQIFLPDLRFPTSNPLTHSASETLVTGCIRLDGRCAFKIADQKSDLSRRIDIIEPRLDTVSEAYFDNPSAELNVYSEAEGNLKVIKVSVGNETYELLTITNLDAKAEGVSIDTRADQIVQELEQGLTRSRQERQPQFLSQRGIIAGCVAVGMLLGSLVLVPTERRSKRKKDQLSPSNLSPHQPITTRLNQQQQWNVREVQQRFLQLAQVIIWGGGTIIILGLFPYTRPIQVIMITVLRIPLRIALVGAFTYFLIRSSYALINRFTAALARNSLLGQETNRRVQLRISTISGIAKSVVAVSLSAAGFLVALALVGVDIGPLLAGAGLVGVALSLASQNIIRDAINGFFIILEDQYAVGDAITVGDVGGLVEYINLRITQVRDAEGRLITIPNSEIKIVANLSSNWARADINIPIAYQADIDKALKIVNEVAEAMDCDPNWQEQIIEPPSVLGVENFLDRGLIIRVWIKTLPLKQWEVAREFRRRVKIALESAGIPIPLPQQQIWFNERSVSPMVGDRQDNHS